MKRIYAQNGIVFFYGNPAGYLGDGKAVIDCMFQKEELVSFVKELGFLETVFREGVYDRLSEGGGVKETAEASIGEGRRLRIYQLGQDSPIMMRFISLAERKKRGYDRPRREEYVRVYEGEIENYSLEEVWEKYGRRVPEGFQGHALSISDVIEFADGENSRFFYIEPSGYEEIRFYQGGSLCQRQKLPRAGQKPQNSMRHLEQGTKKTPRSSLMCASSPSVRGTASRERHP